MKGLKVILIISLFLLFVFIGNISHDAKKAQVSFSEIIPIKSSLSSKLVKNLFSNDETQRAYAQNQIKKIVLKDLGYSDWISYSDYIELLVYPIDLFGDNNEELIITMNLSKDIGLVGIYKSYNDIYVLDSKIDNLTNINNIFSIKHNKNNKFFLIVEQVLEEHTGAYFTDNYVQIFTKSDSAFKEVFRQSLDYTSFYYEKWSDPTLTNPKWIKITEKSVIDHISNDDENITIFISKIISKYDAASNNIDTIPDDFKLVEQKNFDIKYFWDEEYNTFIIGKGVILSSKKTVGILEDTSQTVDYLLNLTGKYYKVIDKDYNISYIGEDDIKIN